MARKKTTPKSPAATSLRQYHALRVAKEIAARGLSLTDVAEKAGITRVWLSRFLNPPHRNITINILEKIYDAIHEEGEE